MTLVLKVSQLKTTVNKGVSNSLKEANMTANANFYRKMVCYLKDNSYFCGIILKDFI